MNSESVKEIMPYKSNLILAFLFLIHLAGSAQFVDLKRVDIPVNKELDDEFNLVPYGKDGLVLLTIQSKSFGREQKLVFTKFNTNLEEEWVNSFSPEGLFYLVKYFSNEDFFFCLLKKQDKNDLLILRLDIRRGDYIVSNCNLLTDMDIDIFSVVRSKAIIGGRYNERPVIELINLFDQSSKVLPDIHSNHITINNIEVNPATGELYILMKNSRNCRFYLKIFNYDGKLTSIVTLGDKKKLPVNGRILKTPDGEYLLAGNYADNCSDYSIGFYTHNLSRPDHTEFYEFVNLTNFLNYMPNKRQERVKRRIASKKLKGKDVKLRHRMLLHDPVKSSNGSILLGEVFYPEFKNYNQAFVPIARNYGWLSSNYIAYNNFRYTHALVCNIDNNGKLTWDNSIPLSEIQSRTLDRKVQISVIKDKVILAYPDQGKIKTTTLAKDLEPVTTVLDLSQGNEFLQVLDDQESELSSWFDHVFVAYGIQSVREGNGVFSRDVFYISKLSYE